MQRIRNHLYHHGRFYVSAIVGGLIFLFSGSYASPVRTLAAGDAFFLIYLIGAAAIVYRIDSSGLKKKAAYEDEGIFVVVVIALAVIAFSSLAIVTVLRAKNTPSLPPLILAMAGAPLGWAALHTIAAFHYANLYYARREGASQSVRGLEFPGTKEPGIWEFLYYAFTVGMTAQTSDTDALDTKMRRATLGHSVVSFFYNTAIIAMAVNAVIATAS